MMRGQAARPPNIFFSRTARGTAGNKRGGSVEREGEKEGGREEGMK